MAAAATPGSRKTALDATNGGDQAIMDAWFAKTQAGGGDIADANLTAVQARALYSYN